MINLEDLKTQIKNIPPAEMEGRNVIQLAKDKKTYVCPFCGNGTGKSGDGLAAKRYSWGYNFKCFGGCNGANYDNISLLAAYFGLDTRADFREILRRAAALFGMATNDFPSNDFSSYHNLKPLKNLPPKKSIAETEDEIRIKKLMLKIVGKDLTAPDKLELIPDSDRRGIDIETFRFFHCIFCPKWIHPKLRAQGKSVSTSRRILIPSPGNNHYVAVLLDSDRTIENKKYWKMHTTGKFEIFGLQTLKVHTEYIFVYEGEFNAMTAWQTWKDFNFLRETMNILEVDTAKNIDNGEIVSADSVPYSAFIATGGASELSWIESIDEKCKTFGIVPRVIINFDKDKAGEGGAEKIQKELRARGYMTAINFIEGED